MRMLATHYASKSQPAVYKKVRAERQHFAPPLRGLSQATKFSVGDAATATILTNFVVNDDRISVRSGYKKKATRGTAPVWHLVPWYGTPTALAAASNGELWNAQDGSLLHAGYTSNDWHWTAFANLGEKVYTVMVNGSDGVWSWDGSIVPDTPPLAVTSVSKATEAVVTVSSTDIAKFHDGDRVTMAGITGAAGWTVVNGVHTIKLVGSPANTFTLVGVDTSTATGTAPTGTVTVDTMTGFVREPVTAGPADTWINVNSFNIVVAHQHRLFFADTTNLAVYYLPLYQKTGQVDYLPLNSIFKRGGHIRAMYSWTAGDGENMDDQLVVFTSNGECAIFGGVDPDTDFQISGVFRFDAPMSKHCVINYGGELYVLISTGLAPMSTLMKSETDHLGENERNIISIFLEHAIAGRSAPGWMTFMNPSTGRLFCNVPMGGPNRYDQFVRHMPRGIWMEWEDIPSRCWGWIDPFVYFGDDSGNVYEMHPVHLNDDGQPITCDVQMAWSVFKTMQRKNFKGVRTYMLTDGAPDILLDVKVEYDYAAPLNSPQVSGIPAVSLWDEAIWDKDEWAPGPRPVTIWNGVASSGVVGAVRFRARIDSCAFSITGFDVTFEEEVLSL